MSAGLHRLDRSKPVSDSLGHAAGDEVLREVARRLCDCVRKDNALAEALNFLFQVELIRNRGAWKVVEDLGIAVAEYIGWSNHRRLHSALGLVPPMEFERSHKIIVT